MTEQQRLLFEVRAVVSALDDEHRIHVESIAQTIRNAVKVGREDGLMALALVGAEVAASGQRWPPHK